MNILGIDVVSHSLPIRPGRNLAVICETAARQPIVKRRWATMPHKNSTVVSRTISVRDRSSFSLGMKP